SLCIGNRKASCREFVIVHFVVMNGAYQLIIGTYRKEVDAKAFFPLDIGIGVGMLIQVAQHGEESILIPVEAAPRMKADIRLSVFLPGRDGKQNSGYSRRHFKM